MIRIFVFILLLIVSAPHAHALERITGKVIIVEPTYLPEAITFQMDAGSRTCPKGKWLKWKKNTENNKLVYSTLMTALISGHQINFYVNDNDTNCSGQYLHLLTQ